MFKQSSDFVYIKHIEQYHLRFWYSPHSTAVDDDGLFGETFADKGRTREVADKRSKLKMNIYSRRIML